jgi:hypothetical protein
VTAEDADIVYVSESGPPDPAISQKLDGRVYPTEAPVAWFLAVDSKRVAKTGDPFEWRAPIRVKIDVKRISGGYRVSFLASPRAAKIHATFDGSDPKLVTLVESPEIVAPAGAVRLRVVAEVDGQFGEEESAPLQSGVSEAGGAYTPIKCALKQDAPATMIYKFEPKGYVRGIFRPRLARQGWCAHSRRDGRSEWQPIRAGSHHHSVWEPTFPFRLLISTSL